MSADSIKLDGWIQTSKGRAFYYKDADTFEYDIEEIAHACSNLCRFTGHTREFYSVAQHLVLTSRMMPVGLELYGLLHDASDPFMGDMNSPLKQLNPTFKEIEQFVQGSIYNFFGVHPTEEDYKILKTVDIIMLLTEKRDLMLPCDWGDWVKDYSPFHFTIEPWSPKVAKDIFINEFNKLHEA